MHKPLQPRLLTLLAIALGLLLVTGALLLFRSLREPHLIDVDGKELVLRGRYASVAEVVEAAEIALRPEDYVRPSLASTPPDKGPITVHHASPVEVEIDGQLSTVWSHQTSLASFLAENNLELKPTSRISIDGGELPPASIDSAQLGRSVSISNQTEVFIDDDQNTLSFYTFATTVGQALIEAGIDIYSTDRVHPALNAWLQTGETIVVKRATPVTVRLDGHALDARTKHTSVAETLAEVGVGLIGRDDSWPPLDQPIGDSHEIEIRRGNTAYQETETPLPFASRLQPLDTLEIDQRSLVAPGSAGVLSQLTRIERVGTQTFSQTLVGEWVSQPPADEIVGYGTNVVVRSVETPDGQLSYWRMVRMRVTAYTAADAGRPPSHPGYGITASGRPAGYGVVAIDPEVVPFRSQVYVPGYGVAFAGDTGGGVKGRWIDLGYDDGQIEAWNGYVDVYYLTPVPESDRINFLIPAVVP